jgi:two-component system chemotaxis response regulator CheY
MWGFAKKKSLVIIDDDEIMILFLKKLFEKKYTVYVASDGVEAIQQLSQGIIPDLIITDILMDNINGYEFIEHLSTSVVYRNIPILILSGAPIEDLSLRLPLFKIINKPFDPLQLKDLVDVTILKNINRAHIIIRTAHERNTQQPDHKL